MLYRTLCFSLCLLICQQAQAWFPYIFKVKTEPYAPLSSGISVNNSQLWDTAYFQIPIGFPFIMGGQKLDSLWLNEPTFIGYYTGSEEVSGFWTIDADLCDRGIHDSSASVSPITYALTGTAGSRILKIQFTNMGFWEEMAVYGTNDDYVNLQVWVYEADNSLEFRYGPSKVTHPESYFFFGDQPAACYLDTLGFDTEFYAKHVYYLYDAPAMPLLDSTTDILQTQGLDHIPDSGTVYRFEYAPVHVNGGTDALADVGIYPTPCHDNLYLRNATNKVVEYSVATISGQATGITGRAFRGIQAIDIGLLPGGMYIITLANIDGKQSKGFVKQ